MAAVGSPSFPKGLRVLLVDEQPSKSVVEAQLQQPELQYTVTSVTTSAEALAFLRTGVAAFDVVLAESRVVAGDETVGRSFIDAFEDTPVVLMSECGTTEDVLRAVKLGAVDFLDKPLSLLKLKNIWQHSVRKMMHKAAGPRRERCLCPPAPAPVAPAVSSWTASLGPESPGTPSASADLAEHFSMGSMRAGEGGCEALSADCSVRGSFDCGSGESFMEAMNSAIQQQPATTAAAPLSRPSSFGSLPTPAPVPTASAGNGAAQHWPALHPGCVWGTPINGPVPPPLPGAAAPAPSAPWGTAPAPQPAPAAAPEPTPMIKSSSSGLLPVAASSDDLILPEGFLSEGLSFGKSAAGPLGLKLKKSPSLLHLINSALSSDNLVGLAAMSC